LSASDRLKEQHKLKNQAVSKHRSERAIRFKTFCKIQRHAIGVVGAERGDSSPGYAVGLKRKDYTPFVVRAKEIGKKKSLRQKTGRDLQIKGV